MQYQPAVSIHQFGDPLLGFNHYYLSLSPGFPTEQLSEADLFCLEVAIPSREDAEGIASYLLGRVQ